MLLLPAGAVAVSSRRPLREGVSALCSRPLSSAASVSASATDSSSSSSRYAAGCGMARETSLIPPAPRSLSLADDDDIIVVGVFFLSFLFFFLSFLLPPPPRSRRGVEHDGQSARRMQGWNASLWSTVTSSRHLLANHAASQGLPN